MRLRGNFGKYVKSLLLFFFLMKSEKSTLIELDLSLLHTNVNVVNDRI
jgi:hypothetical protein